ncbi:hypothetical protein BGZ94_007869 [Podila epigama]|nr:hypothetical protein BGZ94_007869 [Podila epigama]
MSENQPTNHLSNPRESVMSLPELRAFIRAYLTLADIRAMVSVSHTWFDFWAPELYSSLYLPEYSQERYEDTPNIIKYGHHVKSLRVYSTSFDWTQFLIAHMPNLQRFELTRAQMTARELDSVLAALPPTVCHLLVVPRSLVQPKIGLVSWFPEPMIRAVANVQNLYSLDWGASGMTVHVDDILHILKHCPHLKSLELRDLKIVYLGSGSKVDHDVFAMSGRPSDPPGPEHPINNTDKDALYGGRRLLKLGLYGSHISDQGLLRLLGIHLTPHNDSTMASSTLFQQQNPWACAPSITSLYLHIIPTNFDAYVSHRQNSLLKQGVPPFSEAEQQSIRDCLRAMTHLETLKLTGYPIDFTVIEDMSYFPNLLGAFIMLMTRVTFEQLNENITRLQEVSTSWLAKQPTGWRVIIGRGNTNYPPKYFIYFGLQEQEQQGKNKA